ncbi:hypothetical protein [Evansella cellulosilytica]|uniref:Uncharacterized protein n=1 Tax=Evansella cellulosilytica (strain ATCC 21833 / DSM 2522 / FERM P-1141 / JCM 9156 / N-4) TaxID=649639 RepID=E6TX46_EVAC2|nr:hypothetical protein [Evansella cellulosilytica]ADU31135.1 hypothetical protein Bcell_2884 [Evansella cellulosilytica DSM 2522]
MGYIPPMKDEQFILYNQRKNNSRTNISPTAPTQIVEFFDVTKEKTYFNEKEKVDYKHKQLNKEKIKHIGEKVENELSGKGKYVDESI